MISARLLFSSSLVYHRLAEVRTCVTDGEDWMFGRLVMRDGRRVYMDLEPVSVCTVPRFTPPIDSMRGRLSLVTKMLACWVSIFT